MKKRSHLIRITLLLSLIETSFLSSCPDDAPAAVATAASCAWLGDVEVLGSFPTHITAWLPAKEDTDRRGRPASENALLRALETLPPLSWETLSARQKRMIGRARDVEVRWADTIFKSAQRAELAAAVSKRVALSDDEYVRHIARGLPKWLRAWLPGDLLSGAKGVSAEENPLLAELRRIYNPTPDDVRHGCTFVWGLLGKIHKESVERAKNRMHKAHRRDRHKERRRSMAVVRVTASGKVKRSYPRIPAGGISTEAYLRMIGEDVEANYDADGEISDGLCAEEETSAADDEGADDSRGAEGLSGVSEGVMFPPLGGGRRIAAGSKTRAPGVW